jgi:hypothetical protein
MDFTNITKNLPDGENMGGIAQTFFLARWADVLTWPTKAVAPATFGELGALVGNIVMKTGKKFTTVYITDDTGEFKIEVVGERDGKSYISRLTGFMPGLNAEGLGFLNLVKNESLVLVAVDSQGRYFILGDALRAATFETMGEGGTGKETAARAGLGFEFSFKTNNVFVYPGTVPVTAAL